MSTHNDRVKSEDNEKEVGTALADVDEEEVKLIILNYGKWKDAKVMDKFLRQHNVAFRKVQKSRQLSFGFIIFNSSEEREASITTLSNLKWNGEYLEFKCALPKKSLNPMKIHKKRLHDDRDRKGNVLDAQSNDNRDDGVEQLDHGNKEIAKHAHEVVTPWAGLSYEEQLERKEEEMKKVLIKIVRLTRRDYAKKAKRVNLERQRHTKKQKTQTIDDDETTNTYIPTWLSSHGSMYVVADEVLYSRPHEAEAEVEWTRVVEAPGIVAVVSFGSELVGVTTNNNILELKRGPTGRYWKPWCNGPEFEKIIALASVRGNLLCCTESGKIFKRHSKSHLVKNGWSTIGAVDGACGIALHNGYAYVCSVRESLGCPLWYRAPIGSDVIESLVFESLPWKIPATHIRGICSHDHQLITLSGLSLIYTNPETATTQDPVLLNLPHTPTHITGFASHKGLCCAMDSIHPSPRIHGYRNKCEFSIGIDADNKPCVGFRMGLFRDGSVIVSSPDNCPNVPLVMLKVCAAMQSLLNTSGIPVYDVKTKIGVWRQLTVRYSERTEQLMIILQVNPSYLNDIEIEHVRTLTIESFRGGSQCGFTVTSLYIQEYSGVSAASEIDPLIHLYGERTIEEQLLGMRFRVSPNAFFQVNTSGAETLYSLVKEHANTDESTLLYDVCCGTGTIGICASKGAGKVVGIEICKAATDDAAANAALNKITNITFVNSKAEDVMKDLLKSKQEDERSLARAVAIVDPPRAGLHHLVLRSLRSCAPVQRIVYVSCNPIGSLIQDSAILCGPRTKSILGQPFQPVHAIPVDMFPHTPHCEMIIVFERVIE